MCWNPGKSFGLWLARDATHAHQAARYLCSPSRFCPHPVFPTGLCSALPWTFLIPNCPPDPEFCRQVFQNLCRLPRKPQNFFSKSGHGFGIACSIRIREAAKRRHFEFVNQLACTTPSTACDESSANSCDKPTSFRV